MVAINFKVEGGHKQISKEEINTELISRLTSLGIKENQIKTILKLHDEDYILDNISYVEEEIKGGKKIKNIPAYLLKAFKVDFRPIETEFEKTQKSIEAKSKKEELDLSILK